MIKDIRSILNKRVLVLDGAMGTMIQRYKLTEEDFRGKRFASSKVLLKGNNDLLCLTRPDVIGAVHRQYLEAGADIIETNTFNAQSVSMADYEMQDCVREINVEAAKLARSIADEFTKLNADKPRFVAGSVGPTNKTASMSPDVSNPGYRAVSFDDLMIAYREQIEALVDGGVDLLLIETVFDTLNAKAALAAADKVRRERNIDLPIMLSVTIADKGGRTLSGQTLGAFVASVSHIDLLSVGLNCSFGASDMKPYLEELGHLCSTYISAYPNAGLPNQLGEYDETPAKMALQIQEYLDEILVNIIGGCCGTTPDHIAAFAGLAGKAVPHTPTEPAHYMRLSGLELLEATPDINFINVGERCNVAGSRKFLRLIKEGKYDEALSIARHQVEDGAQILDINMDEGLLDGAKEMTTFLHLMASDPDISRVPFMIDSSKWEVIEAGLKCVQGKAVVNSISLKNGEEEFLAHARKIRSFGAAVVVMAFDERGQADRFERRIEICKRAYDLLVNDGTDAKDIIFDPNILAIATGIEEHRNYAADYINTVRWIRQNLPHASISGGVSNLSFSFRGNDYIREAMHAVFLYHAIQAGMNMGIVNPGQSVTYEDIPLDLRELIEDVIFNRREEATDELLLVAEGLKEQKGEKSEQRVEEWRTKELDDRLEYALIKGIGDYLQDDLAEALSVYPKAVDIIDQPLMWGMNKVGELFGSGRMFLPQVVKTARTMKQAVAILQPVLEAQKSASAQTKAGKVVIATVKGDVHDIGKNIVAIILACNNYEVIDLGVMTPPEVIIEKIRIEKPDVVCLSGLITPSLEEMCVVAKQMQTAGFSVPLMIGGATTSKLHTAIKITPHYTNGPVVYTKDASQVPGVLAQLLNVETQAGFVQQLYAEYEALKRSAAAKELRLLSYTEACSKRLQIDWKSFCPVVPQLVGREVLKRISLDDVIPFIDWKFFFHAWKLSARFASCSHLDACPACETSWVHGFSETERPKATEALQLYKDARLLLDTLCLTRFDHIKAVFGIYPACADGESICIDNRLNLPVLRQQAENDKGCCLSLADFVAPKGVGYTDYLGAFTVSVQADSLLQQLAENEDTYREMLLRSVLDRLAEAATEWLHAEVRRHYWGYAKEEDLTVDELFAVKYQGIRPAVGYPSLPDQSVNFLFNTDLLGSEEIGVKLTENGVMIPASTVSGLYFAHPDSRYFNVGRIDSDQLAAYVRQSDKDKDTVRKFLSANL